MTEAGISKLAAGCKFLKSLDVRGCSHISKEFLEQLQQSYPLLKEVRC
jgi:hypothetical protein